MLQLPIIHKKRRRWASITKIVFFSCIPLLFSYAVYLQNFINEDYRKMPSIILITVVLITGTIIKIPFRKHNEIGKLIFTKNSIQFLIYGKLFEEKITDIESVKLQITGY